MRALGDTSNGGCCEYGLELSPVFASLPGQVTDLQGENLQGGKVWEGRYSREPFSARRC